MTLTKTPYLLALKIEYWDVLDTDMTFITIWSYNCMLVAILGAIVIFMKGQQTNCIYYRKVWFIIQTFP